MEKGKEKGRIKGRLASLTIRMSALSPLSLAAVLLITLAIASN